MTQRRPYRPSAVVPGAAVAPPAVFPTADRPAPPNTAHPAFAPAPLNDADPVAELERNLATAQAQIEELRAANIARTSELQEVEQRYDSSIAGLDQARVHASRVLARDAVDLGLHIARAVVRRAFEVDADAMLTIVEEALREAATEERLVVKVSPPDAARVQERFAGPEHSLGVESDPQLAPGDCMLESPQLVIDARVATRLESLHEALAACVPQDEVLDVDDPRVEAEASKPQPPPQPDADSSSKAEPTAPTEASPTTEAAPGAPEPSPGTAEAASDISDPVSDVSDPVSDDSDDSC